MALPTSRVVLLLILATVLAYANTLPNSFVWDDEVLVCENSAIRNGTYVPAVFTSGLFHHDSGSTAYYRPLQPVSFMIDYFFWGLNPTGYHLTNLLLHLLCVLLAWRLIERLSRDRGAALVVALLFAVHPVNTNAVAYIAGRADSLALAGMLGAFILFLRCQDHRPDAPGLGLVLYASSIMCYVAALFSRESAMLFPALILVYSLTLGGVVRHPVRRALAATFPFVVILVAFFCWRAAVLDLSGQTLFSRGTLAGWLRLQTIFRAFATYGGLLVWPAHLQMERQVVLGGNGLLLLTIAGAGLALGLALGLWRSYRRSPLIFFGLAWFIITLLPLTGVFNLVATVAEHWLYMPSIGIYLVASTLGVAAWRDLHWSSRAWKPRLVLVVGVAALAVLTARTIRRNEDWHDAATFFAKTKQASAYASAARVNLGRHLLGQGDWDGALTELADAERLNPGDSFAKANLAALYLSRGNLAKACEKNRECLQLDPRDLGAVLRLAYIAEQRNDFVQAKRHYLYATAISDTVWPRLLFGKFLLRHHWFQASQRVADEAREIEPGNAEVFDLLGTIHAEEGQVTLAERAFQQSRRLDRHSCCADINLGLLAYQRGDLVAASSSYSRALRIQPGNVRALYHLGLIHWRRGELELAAQELRQAFAIAPASARIRDALRKITHGERFSQVARARNA